MRFQDLESQAQAVNAAMPSIMVFMDKWYESLRAAALATSNFTKLIEQFTREQRMVLSAWEGEGGTYD